MMSVNCTVYLKLSVIITKWTKLFSPIRFFNINVMDHTKIRISPLDFK